MMNLSINMTGAASNAASLTSNSTHPHDELQTSVIENQALARGSPLAYARIAAVIVQWRSPQATLKINKLKHAHGLRLLA